MTTSRQNAPRQAWIAAACLACAFWPVWRWYALRTVDGSDEPWGVLALVVAVGFVVARRGSVQLLTARRAQGLCMWVLVYALLYRHVPILVLAMLAMAAVGGLVMGAMPTARLGMSWLSLLVLSLPVMATLQFYAGYPMRWSTAWGATALLNLCGVDVAREGLSLVFSGERVLIDVPCSGVRMLWAGGFFASALACALRLSNRHTVWLWALAGVAVLVGNVLRAIWIFLDKTRIYEQPHWMHAGVGVLIFALIGWGVMSMALCMERRTVCVA